MLLVATMAATMFAGCGNDSGKKGSSGGVKEFDAFFAVPGSEINDDNEIQKIIEEKTGVRVKETWLTGQTADEAVGTMIAGGEYPDFIEGASGQKQLYEAGALVPLDDYIEKYPNIKNLFTELEWEKLRQDDGHIYWIPQFSCIKGDEKVCTHNDEAFWIQARVLKWANYPQIKTLDQYFDLIEKYNEANPTMADGTENIPYTILCEDWRYFCLENAPQFLDGYPNDGSCMVDPDTKKILDYNTSDTAVKYFKKLNEEYNKGIVDPESFTQTYDEYISKLSTGRVLGMIDQWWDFAFTAGDAIKQAGLAEQGCDYIPVPVTIDGRDNQCVRGCFQTSSRHIGPAVTGSVQQAVGLHISSISGRSVGVQLTALKQRLKGSHLRSQLRLGALGRSGRELQVAVIADHTNSVIFVGRVGIAETHIKCSAVGHFPGVDHALNSGSQLAVHIQDRLFAVIRNGIIGLLAGRYGHLFGSGLICTAGINGKRAVAAQADKVLVRSSQCKHGAAGAQVVIVRLSGMAKGNGKAVRFHQCLDHRVIHKHLTLIEPQLAALLCNTGLVQLVLIGVAAGIRLLGIGPVRGQV